MLRRVLIACTCMVFVPALVSAAGPAKDAAKKPAVKDPKDALATKLKNPLIKGGLKKALEQIEKLSGMKIAADWKAIKDTGAGPNTEVLAKASSATAEQLLDMVLIQASQPRLPLSWYVDGKVVRVTTHLRRLYRGKLVSVPRAPVSARPVKQRRVGALRVVDFNQVKLKHVISFIRDISGVSIHVNWRSLELAGITRDTPVTLKARDITCAQVLDLLTDDLSPGLDKFSRVYWLVDGGMVRIATGSAFDQNLRTKIFDVSDLMMIVPNHRAPKIDFGTSGNNTRNGNTNDRDSIFDDDDDDDDDNDEESLSEQRKKLRETLVQAIKDTIGEDMWQPQGKGSIRIFRSQLIVSQTLLGFELLRRAGR